VKYISSFERAVAFEARRRGVDGMICGHIHRPEISDIDGVLYCNDGDWVESCTALVEDAEGRISLRRWTEDVELLADETSPVAVALEQAA
jgi:UDP-2,3-diacylglucosamine pyrophosphatase LpxH